MLRGTCPISYLSLASTSTSLVQEEPAQPRGRGDEALPPPPGRGEGYTSLGIRGTGLPLLQRVRALPSYVGKMTINISFFNGHNLKRLKILIF